MDYQSIHGEVTMMACPLIMTILGTLVVYDCVWLARHVVH